MREPGRCTHALETTLDFVTRVRPVRPLCARDGAALRDELCMQTSGVGDEGWLVLCGHIGQVRLGLQPLSTALHIVRRLARRRVLGVAGLFDSRCVLGLLNGVAAARGVVVRHVEQLQSICFELRLHQLHLTHLKPQQHVAADPCGSTRARRPGRMPRVDAQPVLARFERPVEPEALPSLRRARDGAVTPSLDAGAAGSMHRRKVHQRGRGERRRGGRRRHVKRRHLDKDARGLGAAGGVERATSRGGVRPCFAAQAQF